MPHLLGFDESLFDFLKNEQVNFVQILHKGTIKVLLYAVDMREESFKEAIQSNHRGEDSINSEILAADVKERRI